MFKESNFVAKANSVHATTCGSRKELILLFNDLFTFANADEITSVLEYAIETTMSADDFDKPISCSMAFLQIKLMNFFNKANYLLRKEDCHA
ncbi:MAG: hypothetical protein ACWA5P_02045 [bacterium]